MDEGEKMNITYLLSKVQNSPRKRKQTVNSKSEMKAPHSRAGDMSVSLEDVVHTPEEV